MLKLKTTTEFQVPYGRGFKSAIVRMILDDLIIRKNGVTTTGYYYILDENNNVVQLDKIDATTLKEQIWLAEAVLPEMESSTDFYANAEQRLLQFVMLRLTQEAGVNYGTVASDWVIDEDEPIITE